MFAFIGARCENFFDVLKLIKNHSTKNQQTENGKAKI